MLVKINIVLAKKTTEKYHFLKNDFGTVTTQKPEYDNCIYRSRKLMK